MQQVNVCAPDSCYVKLLNVMPGSDEPNACDKNVVRAARVSFDGGLKGDDQDKALIFYLMRNAHTSPFEMVEFQFEIACPVPIATQWMRHRTGSYNQVSRRYTNEDVTFYLPSEIRTQANWNKQASDSVHPDTRKYRTQLNWAYRECWQIYLDMVNNGVANEQARFILPQGMMTKFIFKMDLHNLFHFVQLRMSNHAQWEIQQLASAMYYDFIRPLAPWCCEAFEAYRIPGIEVEKTIDEKLGIARYEVLSYDEGR